MKDLEVEISSPALLLVLVLLHWQECTISGWGSLGQGSGGYSRRLQAARVPLLPTEECLRQGF
jgi:hypothetical protein